MDSSRAVVCSGEVPCLEGREAARDSFSTCEGEREVSAQMRSAIKWDAV